MKLLVDDPVADHMLDIVGHHRQHGAEQIKAAMGVAQGGKRLRCRRVVGFGAGVHEGCLCWMGKGPRKVGRSIGQSFAVCQW